MHSAECRFLSQVTFESPQFTNLDTSIDIADRIGELYVVDSRLIIDGNENDNVQCAKLLAKLLGVTISSDLTWNKHV